MTSRSGATLWLVALGAAAALALTACAPGRGQATAAPASPDAGLPPAGAASVSIVNFKFDPTPLVVKAGTTVAWTNRDGIAHTVDFSSPDLHSSVLNQSDRFTYTFAGPGSYAYICRIHPFMHGTVVVNA